jgi:hypothetical protein
VSTTLTEPGDLRGVTQVTLVAVTSVKVASVPSKVTLLVPFRSVPVIVTVVPPAAVPLVGVRLVIFGAGTGTGFAVALPLMVQV